MSTNKLAKNYYFSVWKHIKFFPISYDDWHGVQSYKQKRKSRSHNNGKKKKLLSPSESSISYNEILGSIDAQV